MSDASESDFAASDSDTGSDACSDGDFDAAAAAAEEDEPVVLSQAELKARNVQAMLSGSLTVARKPMVSGLKCQDVAAVLARPFRAPFAGAAAGHSAELARRLAARRRFVPWGSTANAAAPGRPLALAPPMLGGAGASAPEGVEPLPPGIEPLVLWEDNPANATDTLKPRIEVDHALVRFLRPHQREGVRFMFECVEGLRDFAGAGCILADDMGLGKTLQGITLLWTLLKQGTQGKPTVSRALIVCPTSLVSNWDDECNKWLNGRVKTMPVCESSRADVVSSVARFLGPRNTAQVMIISYETFRVHAERFAEKGDAGVQLVMCDEAHRLKNGDTLTNKALCSVPCARRVMLSGTPMQNHLDEFYSMVGFCNPGLLGTPAEFAKRYERPILAGREPDASEKQLELARERNAALSELVNKFVLRRTNTILSAHLPPKVVEVVCCKLAPLQTSLYAHFLESKAAKAALTGKHTMVLSAITALKKLCNHPKLIYDMVMGAKNTGAGAAGFESCREFFQPGMYDVGSSRGFGRPKSGGMVEGWEFHSGKFAVLARLLAILRAETKDRIVIISNYTQTLDLVQLLCRQNGYPAVRLDGSTSITKRQKLVKQFNDPSENCFAFLLSSKAGGCGINLIGGNRLVLFDPDWNPANDKQAAARCWRDGQKKKCYLYRLLATGSIEEKVFQRQLSKESLQNVVNGEGVLEQASMSKEELRKLFTLDGDTASDTHDNLAGGCAKCPGKHFQGHCHSDASGDGAGGATMELWEEQSDEPNEQNLETWGHHHRPDTIPDPVMRRAAGEDVSFTFSLQVEGCAVVEKETKKGKGSDPVGAAAPAAAPAALPAPAARPAYRLGAGLGARRPLAAVPANRAPAPAAAKPASAAGPARPPARPVTGATRDPSPPVASKPKPKPKPARRGISDSEASESEASESAFDSEDEEEAEEEASAEAPRRSGARLGIGARRGLKAPATGTEQTRAQERTPNASARRPARAAKKPALVEVDSSDTDDDDCVFREVLRASAREADEGEGDSDAVEDSDGDSDARLPSSRAPRPFSKKPAKRPRVSAVNRASGNAPAAGLAAGVEVDARRGRRSEGLGSVPERSERSETESDSDADARSLTSASELCLPSSATTMT